MRKSIYRSGGSKEAEGQDRSRPGWWSLSYRDVRLKRRRRGKRWEEKGKETSETDSIKIELHSADWGRDGRAGELQSKGEAKSGKEVHRALRVSQPPRVKRARRRKGWNN